ncbi:MAG: peptidase S8, partial [Symploca sp. SIO2E6]|nr:peptidase S8 [Symploca sp. SIO2E6]
MKKFISSMLLSSCFCGITGISSLPKLTPAVAQVSPTGELLYNFYGRSIPLRVRQDSVAVSFKPTASTRSLGATEASYLKLQRDLQGGAGTRSLSGSNNVEVKPLGLRYALVNLPAGSRS